MKILIVHPSFHVYGGAELALVKFINYLTKRKHTVDILTTCLIPDIRSELQFNRVIFVDGMEELREKLNNIYLEYNVINFYNHPVEFMLNIAYPSVWYCNEPPDVILDGGTLDEKEKQHVVETITKYAVADKYNQKRLKDIYGVNSTIIPYGVDYDYWSQGESEKWYWKVKDNFVITQSAWIHPRKNQLMAIKVVEKLKDVIPNVKLILCGQLTAYITELMQYIREHKLEKYVLIDGTFGYRDYVRKLYHSSDVIIQPIKNQGGWLTVFEAMSAGKPVIVSEEATCSSILKDNNIGFVVKDIDGFVNGIVSIYKDEVKDKVNPVPFLKELSWEKYCKSLEKLLVSATK